MKFFRDRGTAGRRLAGPLMRFRAERPVVLGLPRGGVAVAAEIARALKAPLDVIVARKLGAPRYPELAIGALAEGSVCLIDGLAVRLLEVSQAEVDEALALETRELERRVRAYRADRPMPSVQSRTVLLVDDGVASGLTVRAAVQTLRQLAAGRIVLAFPVGAPATVAALRPHVGVSPSCPVPRISSKRQARWKRLHGSRPPGLSAMCPEGRNRRERATNLSRRIG